MIPKKVSVRFLFRGTIKMDRKTLINLRSLWDRLTSGKPRKGKKWTCVLYCAAPPVDGDIVIEFDSTIKTGDIVEVCALKVHIASCFGYSDRHKLVVRKHPQTKGPVYSRELIAIECFVKWLVDWADLDPERWLYNFVPTLMVGKMVCTFSRRSYRAFKKLSPAEQFVLGPVLAKEPYVINNYETPFYVQEGKICIKK